MLEANPAEVAVIPERRSIVELSCGEARQFFLKRESYCTMDLPPYFDFSDILKNVAEVLAEKTLSSSLSKKPRDLEHINHLVLNNKDGRYDWRPLELIHPALYVGLVDAITGTDAWRLICKRFDFFRGNPKVKCLSLPVESPNDQTDRAELVAHWLQSVEQKSLELSLDYEFIIQTDIVDCYAAIYTHSVAWALHGKGVAKKKRHDKSLVGNVIDGFLQDMHQGQTNGIPQGSILMDFIAEMVLGYADSELTKKLACDKEEYQILRYRDDYRIFVNSPQVGERILKCLTEVMIDLGLKLGPSKTGISGEVIRSAVKKDKLDWLFRRRGDRDLQKRLLVIHDHSIEHPNSGSLVVAMQKYHERITKEERVDSPLPLAAIVVDVAYRNPRTYPFSAAILSKLISSLETDKEKEKLIRKIAARFRQIPNTGHMEIWLQRISLKFASEGKFEEPLCRLVSEDCAEVWNNDWISYPALRKAVDPKTIIDRKVLEGMDEIIPVGEVDLFQWDYGM